jgi:predicted glutamine amidotransferase
MCRILSVSSESQFGITELLEPFAEVARTSAEYQGHGWGCSWREAGQWRHYHDIKPIWEDDLSRFGETSLLLAHARSAFRDEGIVVENNMPFSDGESVFIFNGELRGVRIKSEGRIGAEKIYNYIRRFDKGDTLVALKKATSIITKQSSYVRAMNIIMSDGNGIWLSTSYSENPDYFQMFQKQAGKIKLVCSHPFANQTDWTRIDNYTTAAL